MPTIGVIIGKLIVGWMFLSVIVIWCPKLFFLYQIAVCFENLNFYFHGDCQYTGVWKYRGVYKISRSLSKNRLYTKMLRIHLFSIFTLRPLNRETLTNVLLTITMS